MPTQKDNMFDPENSGSLSTLTLTSIDAQQPSGLAVEPSDSESQNGQESQIHEAQSFEPLPRARMSTEEADHYPMPTFEQVAKSMSRALRFQNACPHQEEFARQVAEGRHMARAEKDGRSFREDRHAPNPTSRAPRPQTHPIQNAQPPGASPGSKKRRSRHRNRSGARADPASMQSA